MLRVPIRSVCCALILITAITTSAAAQNTPAPAPAPAPADAGPPEEEPKSFSWGLLVAGITQQQPYAGIKRFNFGIPLLYFENRWVQLLGPRLDVKAPEFKWGKDQELSFGLGVNLFGFNGYKPADAPILNGMEERKNGIFAGPFAKWKNPFATVTAEWMLDASRNSKGQRFSVGVERSFGIGQRVMLTPGLNLTALDGKYADYYYGVRGAEARADRRAYVAEGTTNVDFSLRADYMFSQKQALFGALQFTGLGASIKDSPLVDRSTETMIIVGYLFRFK